MESNDNLWDPLRRKYVAHTPEEEVRQWFISDVLNEGMGVPLHMMMSEVPLHFGGKDWRADIVVYGRDTKPLMVVECKRPDVALDQAVVDQAIRYNRVLDVRYIVITNGPKSFFFERHDDQFDFMSHAPLWKDML